MEQTFDFKTLVKLILIFRFAIGSAKTNSEDVKYAWKTIKELSADLVNEQ